VQPLSLSFLFSVSPLQRARALPPRAPLTDLARLAVMSPAISGKAGRGLLHKAEEAGLGGGGGGGKARPPVRRPVGRPLGVVTHAGAPPPPSLDHRHRFLRPPPLPPDGRFTQARLFGVLIDPAVDAAFWATRTPGLRSRDAVACWLFGAASCRTGQTLRRRRCPWWRPSRAHPAWSGSACATR
jgi:hypothetical protein